MTSDSPRIAICFLQSTAGLTLRHSEVGLAWNGTQSDLAVTFVRTRSRITREGKRRKKFAALWPEPGFIRTHVFMTDPIARTGHTVRNLPSWPLPYRLLVAAAILTGLGLASLAIDLPVAQWCRADPIAKPFVRVTNLSELLTHRTDVAILLFRAIWKEFLKVVNFAEVFAQGTGVAILLFTVLWLDPSLAFPSLRWPAIRWPSFQPRAGQQNFARLIGAAAAGGLLTDGLKLLVERVRPRAAGLADLLANGSGLDTFGTSSLVAATSHSDLHSFPSGHAAVAAGLAAGLSWKYPRGLPLFALFAVLASLQRVATQAHYPSDVCWGAACGLLGATIFLGNKPPASCEQITTAKPLI